MIAWFILSGCEPGVVSSAKSSWNLRLAPIVPYNETPFADLDRLTLLLESPTADPVELDLGLPEGGDIVTLDKLPPFEEATISVRGYRGNALAMWGRTEPMTLVDEDFEVPVYVASTESTGWLGPLPEAAYRPGVLALGSGRFQILGGLTLNNNDLLKVEIDTIYEIDLVPPENELVFTEVGLIPAWEDFGGTERDGRYGFTLHELTAPGEDQGKVLLAGGSAAVGLEGSSTITASASVYDPDTLEWEVFTDRSSLITPRTEYTSVSNQQGGVVFWGGMIYDADDRLGEVNTVEMYDPAQRKFQEVGQVSGAGTVDAAAADLGRDGSLFCGGAKLNTIRDDAFDVASSDVCFRVGMDGSVSDAAPLPGGRMGLAMLTLSDGRILAGGGAEQIDPTENLVEFPADNDLWVYDAAADEWSSAGIMAMPRAGHRMALLPDGRVLIVGGAADYTYDTLVSSALSCIEIYDPNASTSALLDGCDADDDAGGLAGRAYFPALAVDPEFGVLIAGGGSATDAVQNAVNLYLPTPAE